MDDELTALLRAANDGDPEAVGRLFETLYAELRHIARARLRKGTYEQLQTTSLVHEAYLRLVRLERLQAADRQHFLAYAARAMRSVVVDLVREGQAERHGGAFEAVTLEDEPGLPAGGADDVIRIHEALDELGGYDERLVRVVEMRYFVGLEMQEIADALGISKRTAERDWERARIFLYESLSQT